MAYTKFRVKVVHYVTKLTGFYYRVVSLRVS